MDSLLRCFDMLRLIPKAPLAISTPEILAKLQGSGYNIDLRTVQRDLSKLSSSHLFPISSTENTKPIYWFWPAGFNRLQLPMMSSDEALTLKLVEMFLEPLLPHAIKSHMSEYFQLADSTLKVSPLACWIDKVRIISNGLNLLPPEINPVVLPVIYEALLKNCRFDAIYQGQNSTAKIYEMNPLGLVFRNNLIYLVATVGDYLIVKQFALHRFQYAKLGSNKVTIPSDFTLDGYIAEGEFDYPVTDSPQEVALQLEITGFMRKHLIETPLSQNQRITELDDDLYLLEASIQDTYQLRWWIRSFSTNIEVMEPVELRAEFAREARALNKMYR
ncbi:helix-turn-helix transcriptional regulator [Methylobacter psychrophilus]|uniref:helix-turn-helix transcriptional regulator n=1 Tax=Methylobacter psychrophilus TaxID=96941 RepID=UPI0021D4DD9A|nr:WYL domain-containing protein [Methylobacter psychrophilus]